MTARKLRDSAFVFMVFGAILAFLTVPGHAREEGCSASLYTCSSSCSDIAGSTACEACGEGYVPNAAQSGSCGSHLSGNCGGACGLNCYGQSWGCHLPRIE